MSLSFDDVAAALLASEWVYAKTMPEHPHHYTLRKRWSPELPPFEDVVQFIRDRGYREQFGRSYYRRLDVNEHKYWTMGAPLPVTILINRAVIDRPAPYDAIAAQYDALWSSPAAKAENQAVIESLGYDGGDVLDVGCGSGLLLDYLKPDNYLGIDPSRAMLDLLSARHPQAETICTTFESLYTERRFDLIVGMFGSAAYVTPEAWTRLPRMLKPGGRFFLMFFAPGYSPVTHTATGLELPFYSHHEAATGLDGKAERMGDFCVLRS